ncbi:hypothetical protein [Catalinimonas alkaloidigena]|nr:hypothetical protein [Catalinimonas alkaloidigena]
MWVSVTTWLLRLQGKTQLEIDVFLVRTMAKRLFSGRLTGKQRRHYEVRFYRMMDHLKRTREPRAFHQLAGIMEEEIKMGVKLQTRKIEQLVKKMSDLKKLREKYSSGY